ncbi:hypothetical protein ACRARG_02035 [Pseudooceanicola sp. C21-150M6]|uniref:hypothetical protein n=1 Tax=Pseudooceanicola sp. C21-150M6 TaxID=3434355 RepID=UPI003D7F2A3F
MSDIDDLQRRLNAALDRIGRGIAALPDASAPQNPPEDSGLQAKSDALEAQVAEQKTALAEMNREMNRLRKSNAQLREITQSLRTANESFLGDADTIDTALKMELEALRASHAAAEAEVRAVMDALAPLIAPAPATQRSQTEDV